MKISVFATNIFVDDSSKELKAHNFDLSPCLLYMLTSKPGIFSQYPLTQRDKFLEEEVIELARLKALELDIGKGLYEQLSEKDRKFILETEGVVSLGYEASWQDLGKIFKYIEKYRK